MWQICDTFTANSYQNDLNFLLSHFSCPKVNDLQDLYLKVKLIVPPLIILIDLQASQLKVIIIE